MRRVAVVAALVGLALLGTAGPALAHNSLIDSDPKHESTVDKGPGNVTLTFDQPVRDGEGLNSIAVVGPKGDRWEAGPATVDSNVVSAPVRELGPKGIYKIGYRIMSADGHPVSGELTFNLTRAGDGTPAPAQNSRLSGEGGGGIPLWVWIGGAVVLLGAGLVFALRFGGKQPT